MPYLEHAVRLQGSTRLKICQLRSLLDRTIFRHFHAPWRMWVLYTSELQRSTNYICKFQNIDIEITVNTFCITALYWVDLKIPEKVFNPLVHILQNPGNQSTIITLLYCRWNRGSSSGYHAQITGCKSAIRSLLLSLGFTGYSAEISGYSKKKKKKIRE